MAAAPEGTETIDWVREICRALPECLVEGDQHHKLSVRGKTMGWHTVDHHGDGRVALTLKAALVEISGADGPRRPLPRGGARCST